MDRLANRSIANNRLLLPLAAALLNQLYLFPSFESDFKLAAGVLLLGWGSLMLPRKQLLPNAVATGALTVLLRMAAGLIFLGISPADAFFGELPSMAFYLVYGLLLWIVVPSRFLEPLYPFYVALALAGCDLAGNLADSFCRASLDQAMLRTVLAVALLRGTVSMAAAVAYRYHRTHLAEEEQRRRYLEQTMRVAQLRAETIYLQKSAGDIERVMKQGYAMYEQFREQPEVARPSLEIARGIHEVGKDYRRIVAELQALIGEVRQQPMLLSEVLALVHESTERFLAGQEDPPRILVCCKGDGPISQFYSMLSIINNLVINAAQAVGEDGTIEVNAELDEARLLLTVSDNGPGIEEELRQDIFLPGFTTKFDPRTGEASAGIGLCHVKNLVEESGGSIRLTSVAGVETRFTVEIPRSNRSRKGGAANGNADAH